MWKFTSTKTTVEEEEEMKLEPYSEEIVLQVKASQNVANYDQFLKLKDRLHPLLKESNRKKAKEILGEEFKNCTATHGPVQYLEYERYSNGSADLITIFTKHNKEETTKEG